MTRTIPLMVLVTAVAGGLFFSQRLGWFDTVGMLACSAVAGCALAMLAARRG